MDLEDQGYLAGFILGDGCAHYNKANRAYEVTIDQIHSNKYLMRKLKNPLQMHGKIHMYEFNSPDGKKWRLRVHKKDLYLQVKNLKTDPVYFFNNLNNVQKFEFIAGYVDADGTYTDRLVLYSRKINLLKTLRDFLKKEANLNSGIYEFNASSFNKENKLIYGLQISTVTKRNELLKIIPSIKLEYKGKT